MPSVDASDVLVVGVIAIALFAYFYKKRQAEEQLKLKNAAALYVPFASMEMRC